MTRAAPSASAAGLTATGEAPAREAPVFPSVLCGVGAGMPSLDAAQQAAAAAAGGRLTLVEIGGLEGVGPEWAELAAAFVPAACDADAPEVLEIPADDALPSLLLLAGRHDLLAIGAHDAGSGREDIPPTIVHQSPLPVLVARPARGQAEVADRILAVGDPARRGVGDRDGARRAPRLDGADAADRGRRRVRRPRSRRARGARRGRGFRRDARRHLEPWTGRSRGARERLRRRRGSGPCSVLVLRPS